MFIPVLPIVGLNIDNKTKDYIKELMHKTLKKEPILIDIKILPDPKNEFDVNAIKILINDLQVGFIAKSDQYHFDFIRNSVYAANIVSWGVQKDSSVFVYIQPMPLVVNNV